MTSNRRQHAKRGGITHGDADSADACTGSGTRAPREGKGKRRGGDRGHERRKLARVGEGARVVWSTGTEGENHPGGVLPHIATIDTWRDQREQTASVSPCSFVTPAHRWASAASPVGRQTSLSIWKGEDQTALSVEEVCRTCTTSSMFISARS